MREYSYITVLLMDLTSFLTIKDPAADRGSCYKNN